MKKNYYHKKSSLFLFFIIILLLGAPSQGAGKFHPFTIKLKNPLHMQRNRTDIFGKSTPKMVLDSVGKNDLLSGNESYEYPLWFLNQTIEILNNPIIVDL